MIAMDHWHFDPLNINVFVALRAFNAYQVN
jgi:hypothetical protein